MRTNYKICKALIFLYETTLIFSANFTTPTQKKNEKKYKESIYKESSSINKLYSNSKIAKTPSNSPENSDKYHYFNGNNYTQDSNANSNSNNSSSIEKHHKLINIISSAKSEEEKNLNYIPISDEENKNSDNTNIMKNLFSVFAKESNKPQYNEIDKNTETNDNTEKTDADKQDNSKKTILYINHGGSTDKTNCCLCCR